MGPLLLDLKDTGSVGRAIGWARCYLLRQARYFFMGFSDELFFAPAHKLAAMLRKREVSSVELVDAFIERIETVNRGLNAVVTLVEERAVARGGGF